ncbi:MAG: Wzz/FepE/Etk N-terminal domain-containing protein [Paracoccaceae bacterium]
MGHIQTFDELIAFFLRRKWLILAIALIGAALSVAVAKMRPDSYEAAAVIQIEAPAVGQVADPGAPTGRSTADLLQAVEQRLTSRENMMAVIERHRLFADLPGLTADQKIALLRQSVTFQSVASAGAAAFGAPAQVSAMIISARSGDAEQAARVANDFAQSLLDEGTASQTARARETLAFYQEDARRIEADMAALDSEVAAYRAAHADSLPAVRDARQEELTGIDTDLRAVERDLAGLNGEKAVAERQGTTRFTDQRRLDELNAQISVAEAQRDALASRREAIQQSLSSVAEVDRVLSGYDRRAQQLQAQYEVASRRLAEADASSRLTDRRQAERITLLERAVTPDVASSSGGKKIVMAGVLGSLIAGAVLAFLIEWLHPVVRTADQMERELGLRPVVSIPEIAVARPRRRGGKVRLLDDPQKSPPGLPGFAMMAAGATLFLVAAAAVIG